MTSNLYEKLVTKISHVNEQVTPPLTDCAHLSFIDIKSISQQLTKSDEARYLAVVVEKRLEWLFNSGRFIHALETNYLYDIDGLALGLLLKSYGITIPEQIQEKLTTLSNQFDFDKTPYQRVAIQFERLKIKA